MDERSTLDERMMTIVAAALKLNADARDAYLRLACGGDRHLYAEAAEAVDWEEQMGGFLQHPMIAVRDSNLPFVPGETVSQRFHIIRKIGEGGMGVVYEVFDRKRDQTIAIKSAKPGFGRLLSPELQASLKVRHPNVCLVNEIHSAQTASGDVDFLTMELLSGETLSDALARRGRLPASEAQEVARQLCAGLKEAHRSGVIHRDLKPGNVILCPDSNGGFRAVITDFGLAGEAARAGFFGTQRYMAPELLLGQKASPASDIFALGVILYEMVGGAKPGEESNAMGVIPSQASRAYHGILEEFLSVQPERRCRAFDTAFQKLSRNPLSRRQLAGLGIGSVIAIAGGNWLAREKIGNWLRPLPSKRFVALLAWPPDKNQQAKSIVSGAIDAIENELARAEVADRNLFVTSARDVAIDGRENGWLSKLGDSLGVNLALQTSSIRRPNEFGLLLKLVDVTTGAVLRQHQSFCPVNEIAALSVKAVQSAALLLNVHWDEQDGARVKASTNSAAALEAFQAAEALWRVPNDEGLPAAIESYKKAIDADAKYAAAYTGLAIAYRRSYAINADSGVLELARANAMKAIQLDKKMANGHLALAMVLSAQGDFEAAQREMALGARLDPTNPKNLPWQAQIYLHFHHWEEAEKTYLRLQKERPNYWVSYNNYGALLARMGRYREAIAAFHVAAAAAPRSALAFNNLGALHFKLGQPEQAEENYRRSIAIKATGLAFLNLGETLRVEGKFDEAAASCKAALKLAPSNDENWLGLADSYASMGGHEKDAVEAFQKAESEAERLVEVDPKDGAAVIRLTLYRMKTRPFKDWSSLVKESEAQPPLDVDSDLLRVRVLELAGKRTEALTWVASCLRRGPVRFQIDSVRDLRRLSSDPRYSQLLKLAYHKLQR